MKRTIGALALGGVLLASAACSSTGTNTANTTAPGSTAAPGTTAPGASSTTAKPNDTKVTTDGAKTKVTKPSKVEKVDKAKLPTKAQSADKLQGLSGEEQDCIDYVVYETVTGDPTLAESDLSLAGVVGGSIVACVPQEKIAVGLTADIKSSPVGAGLTEEQEACLTTSFAKTSSDTLATIIGALAINEPTILTQAATELDSLCGTKLAS